MPSHIEDLFVRLINHRVSNEHARWEDYLTECFAHLLEHDLALQARILGPEGLVFGRQHGDRGPRVDERLTFSTQASLDRHSRPDVIIEGDQGFLLLVECKAGAPYEPQQILRYVQHASDRERGSVVAIIPQGSRPVDSGVDGPVFQGIVEWEQVAEVLRSLPSTGEALQLLRSSLLQLLDRYGLIPLENEVPWETQEGAEGVEAVRRLCRVLDGEARLVAGNDTLMSLAPRFYRPEEGRWQLAPNPLTIQGKGPPPRKVMAHSVGLRPVIGKFGTLTFNVGFLTSSYSRPKIPSLGLCLDLQRTVRSYQNSAAKFLKQYLDAGGLLDSKHLEFDEHRAMELWTRTMRRGTSLMQSVAKHPALQELIDDEHLDVSTVGMQIWLTMAPTTALLGPGHTEPSLVAKDYRRWLEACIRAYFDSNPMEPFAQFIAEAVMPAIGRFSGERF